MKRKAKAAVLAIIADLSDRRGLKWEWARIDRDVQDEIIEAWTGHILWAFEDSKKEVVYTIEHPDGRGILGPSPDGEAIFEQFRSMYQDFPKKTYLMYKWWGVNNKSLYRNILVPDDFEVKKDE